MIQKRRMSGTLARDEIFQGTEKDGSKEICHISFCTSTKSSGDNYFRAPDSFMKQINVRQCHSYFFKYTSDDEYKLFLGWLTPIYLQNTPFISSFLDELLRQIFRRQDNETA